MPASYPSHSDLNNRSSAEPNFAPVSPSLSTAFSTPQAGSNYADWLEEKLLFYLAELKLQPTLTVTHSASNNAVEVKVRPQIKASYHLETERFEVIMYLLDNLGDLRAKQPSNQHYNRTTAERLSQWLGWPVTFNTGQWGVVITIWLRGSPEQLTQSQRQQQRPSRNHQGQGERQHPSGASAAMREWAASSSEAAGQISSPSQIQPTTTTTSLLSDLDFFDYVNLETHLHDSGNGNGSVIPSLCLGLSQHGPLKHRLTTLKHMAIAGPTGSGKSGVLRSLLAQVLLGELFSTSSSLIALVDLESITFNSALFEGLPQIYQNKVLTDQGEVSRLFEYLAEQKELRSSYYNLCYAEDLEEYNRLAQTKDLPIFPTIFVMLEEASELADLMGKAFTEPLRTILRTGRKYGIFVVLAGQRFHDDTIPSGSKNELATRVALGDCGTQTLRVLEFNPRQHRLSQISEGRGLFKLNGQVTEVQGLNLPKARFIDLVNQLRGKSGLALLPNGERGWLAPSPTNFNQSGRGHFQAWPDPQSSSAASASFPMAIAATSFSTRPRSETGTIPAHTGAVSPGGEVTPLLPLSPSRPWQSPAPRVGSGPTTSPVPVQPQVQARPFESRLVTPATFGQGSPQPPAPPNPLTPSLRVDVPMPPMPPVPPMPAPLLLNVIALEPGLSGLNFAYSPPNPALPATQPQAVAGLQPLPPGLLGQAANTGLDPLSLLTAWAAASAQPALNSPSGAGPTQSSDSPPVVTTNATIAGAASQPLQPDQSQTSATQTHTQPGADPELVAMRWQAQRQLAERDPKQKPNLRSVANTLGWTYYRAQKAYNEARAIGLIK